MTWKDANIRRTRYRPAAVLGQTMPSEEGLEMGRAVVSSLTVGLFWASAAVAAEKPEGCAKGTQPFKRKGGDTVCLSQKMLELLTCLTETTGPDVSESNKQAKENLVDIKAAGEGEALVTSGKGSVNISTKSVEQSQKQLKKIFNPKVVDACVHGAPPPKSGKAPVAEPGKIELASQREKKECSIRQPISLVGRAVNAWGQQGHTCQMDSTGAITLNMTDRDGDWALCCVDLPTNIDLKNVSRVCADFELAQPEKKLDVKLEVPDSPKQIFVVGGSVQPGRQAKSHVLTEKQQGWKGVNRVCFGPVGGGPPSNEVRLHAIGFE